MTFTRRALDGVVAALRRFQLPTQGRLLTPARHILLDGIGEVEPDVAWQVPQLTRSRRALLVREINASNRSLRKVATAVNREFNCIDWQKPTKGFVVNHLVAAIQGVDSASSYALNKATRTVITEIYAIEDWPTTKKVVRARAVAAIRRLQVAA
jgi:hypothetical protein